MDRVEGKTEVSFSSSILIVSIIIMLVSVIPSSLVVWIQEDVRRSSACTFVAHLSACEITIGSSVLMWQGDDTIQDQLLFPANFIGWVGKIVKCWLQVNCGDCESVRCWQSCSSLDQEHLLMKIYLLLLCSCWNSEAFLVEPIGKNLLNLNCFWGLLLPFKIP